MDQKNSKYGHVSRSVRSGVFEKNNFKIERNPKQSSLVRSFLINVRFLKPKSS